MNRVGNVAGAARIAIVGAESPTGALVRDALAEVRVDGRRVEMYSLRTGGGEALLGEYSGEARLIQEPDLDLILAHDVIFLCRHGELAAQIAAGVSAPAVLIDLVGACAEKIGVTHPELDPDNQPPTASHYSLAHPLAMLIAEVLLPLEKEFGITEAVGTMLRPASDFGRAGVDELREQVVRLLNFSELPTQIFGRQLAFNLLNEEQGPSAGSGTERRIAADVGLLLGWSEARLALQMVTVPIFFGHSVQLRVRLRRETTLEQLTESLRHSRFFDAPTEEQASTPLELSTESRISLSPPTEDGLGGYWLWFSAGETAGRAARQAVRLARSVSDL